MYDNTDNSRTVRCSFCGKTQEEVKNCCWSVSIFVMNVLIYVKRLLMKEFYDEAVRELTDVPKPQKF